MATVMAMDMTMVTPKVMPMDMAMEKNMAIMTRMEKRRSRFGAD